MRCRPGRLGNDDGFSIIEVMMALVLLATSMAAMGPFFIRSFLDVARQRGDQSAIELANNTIDQVRGLEGGALLDERGHDAVLQQWQRAYDDPRTAMRSYLDVPGKPVVPGVNRKLTMKMDWKREPPVAATSGSAAPLSTDTQEFSIKAADTSAPSTTYHRDIFVGECDVYLVNVAGYVANSSACVNPDVVPPPADHTKVLRFFRVVVLVTWTDKSCAGNQCSYIASTLVSRDPDPKFDFNRPSPLIPDQTIVLYAGEESTYLLDADHGQLPNRWTLASGTLPTGFTLSPGGLITSNVPTPRTGSLHLRLTDAKGRNIDKLLPYRVVTGPKVTTTLPVRHYLATPVTLQLTAADGAAPYTFGATGLPPGLKLDQAASDPATGKIVISGTPTTAGAFQVTVTAMEDGGRVGTVKYTHTIYNALQLTPISDRSVTVATPFSASASAVGGLTPYTYSATGLPAGVSISASTGAMSGTPTVPGRYLPAITVKDAMGGTFSTSFVLTVNSPTGLVITPPGNQVANVGEHAELLLESNAGLLGLRPTFTATGVPDGVVLNPQGRFAGRPTTPGTYTVTVTGSNLLPPQTSVATFLWTVR